jgi:septal ring factor EnvC (AmiA/AmiB activator)
MRIPGWSRVVVRIGAGALLLQTGCGLPQSLGLLGTNGTDAQALAHKTPPAVVPVVPGPPPNFTDQISLMSQRLASTEDDRKTLAARLQQAEMQLEEKDQALAAVGHEILAATEEVARTRDELRRFKGEMEALRNRLKNAEKEDRATLESIIKMLEHMLEQDKRPADPTPKPIE